MQNISTGNEGDFHDYEGGHGDNVDDVDDQVDHHDDVDDQSHTDDEEPAKCEAQLLEYLNRVTLQTKQETH